MDFKVGDYIVIKDGCKEPDEEKYDMGGWKGVITELYEAEKNDEANVLTVQWDSDTLLMMPPEYIRSSIMASASIAGMNIDAAWAQRLEGIEMEEEAITNSILEALEKKHVSELNSSMSVLSGLADERFEVWRKTVLAYKKSLSPEEKELHRVEQAEHLASGVIGATQEKLFLMYLNAYYPERDPANEFKLPLPHYDDVDRYIYLRPVSKQEAETKNVIYDMEHQVYYWLEDVIGKVE